MRRRWRLRGARTFHAVIPIFVCPSYTRSVSSLIRIAGWLWSYLSGNRPPELMRGERVLRSGYVIRVGPRLMWRAYDTGFLFVTTRRLFFRPMGLTVPFGSDVSDIHLSDVEQVEPWSTDFLLYKFRRTPAYAVDSALDGHLVFHTN